MYGYLLLPSFDILLSFFRSFVMVVYIESFMLWPGVISNIAPGVSFLKMVMYVLYACNFYGMRIKKSSEN